MSQTAIVAGGCFWGMEARYQTLPGVLDTEVGYTGGHLEDPTYRDVCQDDTGHVEAVRIEFDPTQISYRQILEAFSLFMMPPYAMKIAAPRALSIARSFSTNEEQQQIAESALIEPNRKTDRMQDRHCHHSCQHLLRG